MRVGITYLDGPVRISVTTPDPEIAAQKFVAIRQAGYEIEKVEQYGRRRNFQLFPWNSKDQRHSDLFFNLVEIEEAKGSVPL